MEDERLRFSDLKVLRGWYFVEYGPPSAETPFATLGVTTLEKAEPAKIAAVMESEVALWLARYPIPIMVSSYSDTGGLLDLSAVRDCNHAFGWLDSGTGAQVIHWRIVRPDELPSVDLAPATLRRLYADVPIKPPFDAATESRRRRRIGRQGSAIVIAGMVAVPAVWLLVELNAPRWLEWLIMFFGAAQLYIKAMKLAGLWPKTVADAAAAEKELRMRHHHYHCDRNPDGFRRLVAENWEREARERTHREADELRRLDQNRTA